MDNKKLVIECSDGLISAKVFVSNTAVARFDIDRRMLPEDYRDNFFYACAYAIDELMKADDLRKKKEESVKYYAGKAVCVASPDSAEFKVGKIYEWRDGRVVNERGDLVPRTKKLTSLDEITNPALKFIVLIEE